MKKIIHLIIVFLVGFLGSISGYILAPLLQSTTSPQSSQSNQAVGSTTVNKVNYDNETSVTKAVKVVQDAVVSVINYQTTNEQDSLFEIGNQEDGLAVASEGSGVIYKKTGEEAYIVTNTHVVAGAEKIDIQLASGEKVEATLVGSDTYSDTAVLKIKADKVTTVAEFADSEKLNVGEIAIAIGSPLGSKYANSVTQGIVSSLSRTVVSQSEDGQTVSINAIQTDTAINPGNSGGPLINIEGQVIGITSSKIASTPTSLSTGISVEGMGFAIPSNDAVSIINQLETDSTVSRPALGINMVNISSLSNHQRRLAGLENSKIKEGVLVVSTQSGLPADSKLEKYDIITAINGETIHSTSDLQSELYKHKIGDTLTITYYRKNKEKTVDIQLTHSTSDLE